MTRDDLKRAAVVLGVAGFLAGPLANAQHKAPPGFLFDQPTGEVRGTITVIRKTESPQLPPPLLERYGSHGVESLRMHAMGAAPLKLSEKAVVYLESEALNNGVYPPPAAHPMLDQKNLQFHPQVLPILVGTTVDFPNRDNLFHNVFSYSGPKDFDLGRYPKDDSRSVTFDKPGIVRVYCDIHSHMNATILVLQHPFFARADDDGSFVIRGIPAGKYWLVFWYDRDVVERRRIEVRAGQVVELGLSL